MISTWHVFLGVLAALLAVPFVLAAALAFIVIVSDFVRGFVRGYRAARK
jgi:hypothetical protein